MADRQWDPNPKRGKASFSDKLKTVVVLLVEAPLVLTRVCFRRLFHGANLSFRDDFLRTMLRDVSAAIPMPFKRMVLTPKNLPDILNSNRFKHLPGPLCEEILEENLAGFWICRGLKRTLPANECDLVILYVHGGAFILGHPLTAVASYLRIAEIAEENGFSVGIFALNYTLAPEARFPTQQNQLLSAYKYLVERLKVDPSRVVISGQSAGGWLVMSFLHALKAERLPRPGAAWMLYPWLDLTNSKQSFQTNRYNDTLSRSSLDRSAQEFLGNNRTAIKDFTNIDNPRSILPQYTWVTIGTHDSFLDSNQDFVAAARKDGADIDIVLHEGGCHAWDATLDMGDYKRYILLSPQDDAGNLMKGAEHMANGLIQIRKKLVN